MSNNNINIPKKVIWEVEQLRTTYVVRPQNRCGTCGWIGEKPWTAYFTKSWAVANKIAKQRTANWGKEA